jgi:hypothetical protein
MTDGVMGHSAGALAAGDCQGISQVPALLACLSSCWCHCATTSASDTLLHELF